MAFFALASTFSALPADTTTMLQGTAVVKFSHKSVSMPAGVESCAVAQASFEDTSVLASLQAVGIASLAKCYKFLQAGDTLVPTFGGDTISFASDLDWLRVYFPQQGKYGDTSRISS
jgi:hypothetical protein